MLGIGRGYGSWVERKGDEAGLTIIENNSVALSRASALRVPLEALSLASLAPALSVLSSFYFSSSYIRGVMGGGGERSAGYGEDKGDSIKAATSSSARPRGSVGWRASVACSQKGLEGGEATRGTRPQRGGQRGLTSGGIRAARNAKDRTQENPARGG